MTREEAIEKLEAFAPMVVDDTREAIDMAIEALSADANPTVIRSRTLMLTEDFKEWAKRVRETNPNAVVIPCDAEAVENLDNMNFCPNCGAKMKGREECQN